MNRKEIVLEIKSISFNKLFAAASKILVSNLTDPKTISKLKPIKKGFVIKKKPFDLLFAEFLQHFINLYNDEKLAPFKINVRYDGVLYCKYVSGELNIVKNDLMEIKIEDIRFLINGISFEVCFCIYFPNK
ncbi:hypothetical protein COBT_001836 [Conglomerata obtusa]